MLRGYAVVDGDDFMPAVEALLDCDDEERRQRLADRDPTEIEEAIADGGDYRRLSLPVFDTSALTVDEIVNELTAMIESH